MYTINGNKTGYHPANKYIRKEFISKCEKKYAEVIEKCISPVYKLIPQINLASIIQKENETKYNTDLFRNIDFGIFTRYYDLLVLIEINDPTHERRDRIGRDKSVKYILDEAGIPLVTFWTKYGTNEEYIKERLKKYCLTV